MAITVPSLLKVVVLFFLFQGLSVEVASNALQICPPGTYITNVRNGVTCEECRNGYYQDKSGQNGCLLCPAGHSCPSPKTRAIPCLPGTESYNDLYNYEKRLVCRNCSDGYYQDKPGQRDCIICPTGHSCPSPKTRAIPCPPGTESYNDFPYEKRLVCRTCSDGYYQDKPGQGNCLPCPRGRYCATPKDRAIPCPVGTYNGNEAQVSCMVCQNGRYQDKTGQSNCLLCPEGYECPSPKNRYFPCPPGHFSSYWRTTSQLLNCLACNAGYYQASAGQKHCKLCPDGHYCPQKENNPVPCPAGFTSPSTVSQKISCVKCSPEDCPAAVPPPVICRAGMFLDSATRTCKPCEVGRYQDQPGQNDCLICPEGFYCPTITNKPIPCPIGTFSTNEMGLRTACVACSIGTYQSEQGQNLCMTCPAGHFCPNPRLNPVPCPTGTYSTTSTTDRTKCLPCPGREYQDQEGQHVCKVCPAGYFCKSVNPQQCPPNTYSTLEHTDREKCLPCVRGHYQDQCGQGHCKPLLADGCPSPEPSLPCSILNTSETVPDNQSGCSNSGGTYSGALVRLMVGNNDIQYPVVKISHRHLSSGGNISDDHILASTAFAFDAMATAAKTEGVTITINSGFRTCERQKELHKCYITQTCNNGRLAAIPGTSRHGTGVALDLNTNCGNQMKNQTHPPQCATSTVYMWLKNNGHRFGFVRTVVVEPWHWEFKGGPVDGPSIFT